jgi:predicted alpha/beta-hydrolase family hydrolase
MAREAVSGAGPPEDIRIPPMGLDGILRPVPQPRGIVVFAHGSGSSRLSPRNVRVAQALGEAGLATLLFDLLTEEEARSRDNVFNIELLADRLLLATAWLGTREALRDVPVGLFGASTGAAAALVAASRVSEVGAVVSRGGRPDLAGAGVLDAVRAPTLLVVGSLDAQVMALNQGALSRLKCEKALQVVEGAGHLFEEPETLEEVTRLSCDWFTAHLSERSR